MLHIQSTNSTATLRPDFILIGAGKAGTTSLIELLSQKREIFISNPKEPRFFCDSQSLRGDPAWPLYRTTICQTWEEYQQLFARAPADSLCGEASIQYLCDSSAPRKIRETLPNVRLIAVLRDPVDRAFSNYLHFARDGVVTAGPDEFFRKNSCARKQVLAESKYGEALRRYFSFFESDSLMILVFEDLRMDMPNAAMSILQWLGVKDAQGQRLQPRHSNISGVHTNSVVARIFRALRHSPPARFTKRFLSNRMRGAISTRVSRMERRFVTRPELTDELRGIIAEELKEDAAILRNVLPDMDFSRWRSANFLDLDHSGAQR